MTEQRRKRGRPPNQTPTRKIEPVLTIEHYACLVRLVELGYAPTPTQVAAYLIQREIDDLKRAGVLPKQTPNLSSPDDPEA